MGEPMTDARLEEIRSGRGLGVAAFFECASEIDRLKAELVSRHCYSAEGGSCACGVSVRSRDGRVILGALIPPKGGSGVVTPKAGDMVWYCKRCSGTLYGGKPICPVCGVGSDLVKKGTGVYCQHPACVSMAQHRTVSRRAGGEVYLCSFHAADIKFVLSFTGQYAPEIESISKDASNAV